MTEEDVQRMATFVGCPKRRTGTCDGKYLWAIPRRCAVQAPVNVKVVEGWDMVEKIAGESSAGEDESQVGTEDMGMGFACIAVEYCMMMWAERSSERPHTNDALLGWGQNFDEMMGLVSEGTEGDGRRCGGVQGFPGLLVKPEA